MGRILKKQDGVVCTIIFQTSQVLFSTYRSGILTKFLLCFSESLHTNTGIIAYNRPCSFPVTLLKTDMSSLEDKAP
jgi:hypothetical protein